MGEVETIRCALCKKERQVRVEYGDGKTWYRMLGNWLVSDTYPPGDNGVQFVCGTECLQELERKNREEDYLATL